jgi:hypothetical protein
MQPVALACVNLDAEIGGLRWELVDEQQPTVGQDFRHSDIHEIDTVSVLKFRCNMCIMQLAV